LRRDPAEAVDVNVEPFRGISRGMLSTRGVSGGSTPYPPGCIVGTTWKMVGLLYFRKSLRIILAVVMTVLLSL
jgi:hypothetical protein